MMVFAWHRASVGNPYPVLWYTAIPAKGEGEPDARNRVLQSHLLSEAEQDELDALSNGVARLDYLAAKYPYHAPQEAAQEPEIALDTAKAEAIALTAIDDAVVRYRTKQRANDGQTAHIDRERWHHV